MCTRSREQTPSVQIRAGVRFLFVALGVLQYLIISIISGPGVIRAMKVKLKSSSAVSKIDTVFSLK